MAVRFYCGNANFDTPHENESRQAILEELSKLRGEWYVVFNFNWAGKNLDYALLSNDTFIIIDCKNEQRPFIATENGPWSIIGSDSAAVSSALYENPYDQVRVYRNSILDHVRKGVHHFVKRDIVQNELKKDRTEFRKQVQGLICVHPRIPEGTLLPIRDSKVPWFEITGSDKLRETVIRHRARSPLFNFTNAELETLIVGVLGCQPFRFEPVQSSEKPASSDPAKLPVPQQHVPPDEPQAPPKRIRPDLAQRTDGQVPHAISAARPGLFLVLIDQSTSMADSWTAASEQSKSEIASSHLNRLIARILDLSQTGKVFRKRIFLAVMGYSSANPDDSRTCRILAKGWPSELAALPEARDRTWIRPQAAGGTPLSEALLSAHRFVEEFFRSPGYSELFSKSIPPVILNITDGRAEEVEAGDWDSVSSAARAIFGMKTPQSASPLLFHAYISDGAAEAFLPPSQAGLDDWGQKLFEISSKIPQSWIEASNGNLNTPVATGATGLILNANPDQLMDLLNFATRMAQP